MTNNKNSLMNGNHILNHSMVNMVYLLGLYHQMVLDVVLLCLVSLQKLNWI